MLDLLDHLDQLAVVVMKVSLDLKELMERLVDLAHRLV